MTSARFRRLARVLVLALLAGLAAPAFASMPGTGRAPAPAPRTHVHPGGPAHVHAKPGTAPAPTQAAVSDGAMPSKPPRHCPGCLGAAGCAASCLGMALLPAPIPVPACPAAQVRTAGALPFPAGANPAADLDPPRPVPAR